MKELVEIRLIALDLDDEAPKELTLNHDEYGVIDFYQNPLTDRDKGLIGIIRTDGVFNPKILEPDSKFFKELDKIEEMGRETDCDYFIKFLQPEAAILIDRVYQEVA
jgi:hypothetical protein